MAWSFDQAPTSMPLLGNQHIMGVINGDIGPSPVAVTTPSGGVMLIWSWTECVMAGAWSAQASGWYWRPPQNGIIPFSDGIEYGQSLPHIKATRCLRHYQ